MGFLLLIVGILLATSTFFYFMHLSGREQRPAKPRRQYHLESSSSKERLLLWSPALSAVAAMIVFSVPPLYRLAEPSLRAVLYRICSSSVPTLWCWKQAWPTSWFLVIHATAYLCFIGMSAYLAFSIMTERIPKPRHYVEGSFPFGLSLASAGFWLFMVAGGQFMLQTRLGHLFPFLGLVFCVGFLCVALSCLRTIAITLKHRRPRTST
ncbi:hypothetical protein [Reyranella sp.]|uniref:hypothetical protein n=1 Tax=Reyranella sp. TaxID=1929291 RepID=UPI003C7BA4FF